MRVEQLALPTNKRILVTSDIHGHLALLQKLLEKVNFSEDDILIIAGDMVERGPESLNTLRYVMNLCRQRGADRVIPLLGNVDLWRIQMLEQLDAESSSSFYQYLENMRSRKRTSLYDEVACELGIRLDSPEKTLAAKALLLEKCSEEFAFLHSLPAVVETQNYIFVHSGLPAEVVESPQRLNLELLKDRNIYDVLKFDDFMSSGLSFPKYVVVGHWPVCLYNSRIDQCNPIINTARHIISIDGGCGLKKDGQLNMLIIPDINCRTKKIISTYCDPFEVCQALTPQEESKDSIHIHWGDNQVRILEKGEDFSYIEHLSSGYRLNLRNQYLYDLDASSQEAKCEDYTDYLLPVKAGDSLSLIRQTPDGYLVKKDGVTGWYRGSLKRKNIAPTGLEKEENSNE